jgi:hypothetical protein
MLECGIESRFAAMFLMQEDVGELSGARDWDFGWKRRAMAGKGIYGLAERAGVAAINWFPGHMASATKAIRESIKLVDLVLEVRDARVCSNSLL